MRILVTGGTGFVGAHCVRALLLAGHDVVLLVRDPARVPGALEPLGLGGDRCDVVAGDVLDEGAVHRALDDAEALLHAANVYSLNAKDAPVMQRVNIDGTRNVLRGAVERGLDPVVHVSSTVALLPSGYLTPESPVGTPHGSYAVSKAAAESVARQLQDEGAPVVITNPAGVYGPHQPHMGESATLVRDILRGRARLVIGGGIGIVDVRDLAVAHARLFAPGGGPRRYLMGGHWVSTADIFRTVAKVVGHRLPRVRTPTRLAFAAGRLAEVAQRRGIDPGFSSSEVWVAANHPEFDDHVTRDVLGVEWRPFEDTVRDTVAWLHEQGQVTSRQAGRAAGAGWSVGEGSAAQPA
jgi:dihydroflavonol-4-reductase